MSGFDQVFATVSGSEGVALWVYQAVFGLVAIVVFFGLLAFIVRSMVAFKRRNDSSQGSE